MKTYYVLAGHRVPKGTPGAEKVQAHARKWYGRCIPGLPHKKRVPLAADREAAQRMLDDLVRQAERRAAGMGDLPPGFYKVDRRTDSPQVYFVAGGERVKIGTSKGVSGRLKELLAASPVPLELLHVMPGGRAQEASLHARFAAHRIRGEWFHFADEIREFIERAKAG